MITFFSGWAKQIIIAVVVTSIIELLLPENKNKKYIKIVMGIYILFCIISPIIDKKELLQFDNIKLGEPATAIDNVKTEEVNQESMDERLQELYVQELENNIKTKVTQEGYVVNSCRVDAVLYGDNEKRGINKISLNISKKESDLKDNLENSQNVKSIKKVDIKLGLSKYYDENKEETCPENAKDEVKFLKEILSQYYEIDKNKIHISLK